MEEASVKVLGAKYQKGGPRNKTLGRRERKEILEKIRGLYVPHKFNRPVSIEQFISSSIPDCSAAQT